MGSKAIFYIDGFNFYHGLNDAIRLLKYKCYLWLDYQLLCENILKRLDPSSELVAVKYFTANVKGGSDRIAQQNLYLDALKTKPKIQIFKGIYQIKKSFDRTLKKEYCYLVEKRTDVNIAVQILVDAHNNKADHIYLVSGDSDFVPIVESIKHYFTDKTIIICFPPCRSHQGDLKSLSHRYFYIRDWILKMSLFPNMVKKNDGNFINEPTDWI